LRRQRKRGGEVREETENDREGEKEKKFRTRKEEGRETEKNGYKQTDKPTIL
jgi:hypothetical protein